MKDELTLFMRPAEKLFFSLLIKFCNTRECPTHEDVRVAGGWVRDGLLKMSNNDLDIALADCTGVVFAEAFQKWLLKSTDMGPATLVVVRANPEKSKHLETAILELPSIGLSVDFVNLRSEKYTENSRIPEAQFGSPEEDAFRRDFTVNTLFYNVMTNQIEDHTNMGVDDITNMVLRTPLPPVKTFMDDPLRIVRAARFLAKFPELKPCEELRAACRDPQVRAAFEAKVTRERVRQELLKIFEYPNPVRALRFMVKCDLMGAVLSLEPEFLDHHQRHTPCVRAAYVETLKDLSRFWTVSVTYLDATHRCVNDLAKDDLPPSCVFWNKETWNKSEVRGAFKFAALLARHDAFCVPDGNGVRTAAEEALLNLRCKSVSVEVRKIHTLMTAIANLSVKNPELEAWAATFRLTGATRWWALAALLMSVVTVCTKDLTRQPPTSLILDHYRQYKYYAFDKFKLEGVSELQPLFNGKEIKKLLPNAVGPQIGQAIDYQIKWLIRNWTPDMQQRLKLANQLKQDLIEQFDGGYY